MQNKILVGRANLTNFWNPVFLYRVSLEHRQTRKLNQILLETSSNTAWPGIAYFIVFRKNSKANETALFSCLHDTGMDASVTRISSNKKLLDEECAMIQGLKQVVKVIKIIFSYFKRTQRQFRNAVRHTIWTSFLKKESVAFKLLTIIAKT